MSNNVSERIKRWANISEAIAWSVGFLGVLLGVPILMVSLVEREKYIGIIFLGFVATMISCLIFCIIGHLLYGFATIIEKVSQIESNTGTNNEDKIQMATIWKEKGLITEKEFNAIKNRLSSSEEMLILAQKKFKDGEITEQQYTAVKTNILNSFIKSGDK